MDTSKLEPILTSLGLWKAIKGYPGLLILVVVSVASLELIAPQTLPLLPSLSTTTLHLFLVIIGTLVGLTGYVAGDFWDSRFFDPRYGLRGKWLRSHTRPFDVFPAGSDLKQYRDKAIQALFGREHSGEGLYREAKKIAMKQAQKWDYIEQPLILSKFVRGFIWPCLLIAVASILGAMGSLVFGWMLNPTALIIAGVVISCFGVLLFIPYSQLRVEHMIRLYEYIDEHISKKQASGN
jgi:hypothetical protein